MFKRALLLNGWDTACDGRFTLASFTLDPPSITQTRQSVPGMSGDIDLSEVAAGYPVYGTRKLTAALETTFGKRSDRIAMIDELISRVHGKRVQIGHPDYPEGHYIGRVEISGIAHHATYSELKLAATCDPFRYSDILTESMFAAKAASTGVSGLDWALVSASDTGLLVTSGNEIGLHVTCSVGEAAVVCITAEENTEYYIAMLQTKGRGHWTVANTNDKHAFEESCTVHTGADGKIYLRFERYSTEALRYVWLRAIPTSELTALSVGVSPLIAEFSAEKTLWISSGGTYAQVGTERTQIALGSENPLIFAVTDSGGEWVKAEYRRLEW